VKYERRKKKEERRKGHIKEERLKHSFKQVQHQVRCFCSQERTIKNTKKKEKYVLKLNILKNYVKSLLRTYLKKILFLKPTVPLFFHVIKFFFISFSSGMVTEPSYIAVFQNEYYSSRCLRCLYNSQHLGPG
jgi:hypothetical protein